ncbi:MAG: hypothetical protein CM1200mP18_03460 [Gammaproteobacteria bacterium]|nr:MAG: hypothetical protein CM1200mP18_03460 [Gammaproteobacteria bacterium]
MSLTCGTSSLLFGPKRENLIRQARAQGHRVGLLTNELELFHGPEVYDAFEILGSFDAIVDATHTGILKPDPRAYQLAVESLDASFQSVVFVDDQQKNIDGAIDCGIEAIRLDITNPGNLGLMMFAGAETHLIHIRFIPEPLGSTCIDRGMLTTD